MFSRRKSDLKEAEKSKPKVTRESFREALKIFQYIRPYRWQFALGMFLLVLGSGLFMIFPRLIGLMLDTAQGNSTYDYTLTQLGVALFVILAVQSLFSFLRVILFAIVSENGIADIRKALYQRLVSFPITFFEENKSGDLISRLTADVEKLYSTFSITLAEFLRQIIFLVVGVFALALLAPQLSGIMLLTVPGVMVGAIFFGRYIRKLSKKRQEQLADSNALLSESIQNIQVVKSFTSEILKSTDMVCRFLG